MAGVYQLLTNKENIFVFSLGICCSHYLKQLDSRCSFPTSAARVQCCESCHYCDQCTLINPLCCQSRFKEVKTGFRDPEELSHSPEQSFPFRYKYCVNIFPGPNFVSPEWRCPLSRCVPKKRFHCGTRTIAKTVSLLRSRY